MAKDMTQDEKRLLQERHRLEQAENRNRALCEADAAPAGALCPMPHLCGSAVIDHAVGVRCCHLYKIPSLKPTVFHQLPAQTCHRQLCLRNDYHFN